MLKHKDLVAWVQEQYGQTFSIVTIRNILKRIREFEELPASNLSANKPRKSQNLLLEKASAFWVLKCQARKVALTGNLIKAKAQKFSEQLAIKETIEFSNGWLQKFQQRHQLRCIKSHGESGSADTTPMEQAIPMLQNTVKDYQPRDIHNMDETGFFCNMSPDKTIAQKQVEGLKKDKTRITLCLTCNADGTDKLEPMIIGHYNKPRCLLHKSGQQLGFYYRSNKESWMTGVLFQEWQLKFHERIKEQRHILLILDNATSHICNGLQLTNTEIQFLPPNTTSQLEPMDGGMISAFKRHYRNYHRQDGLDNDDQGLDNLYKFDQLTAMKWCLVAWKDFPAQTISYCFKHIGLFEDRIRHQHLEDDEEIVESEVQDAISRLAVQNAVSIANFLNRVEEYEGGNE